MKKVLSISVAAYNVKDYIKTALDSYVDFIDREKLEVLVINDGSTDDTAEIVQEYVEKYPETVRLITQKNAGPGSTVNTGIQNATGRYFRMIDGDDWVKTEELSSYIEYLENHDVDLVATEYVQVDDKSGEIFPMPIKDIHDKGKIYNFEDIAGDLLLSMHNVTYKTEILKKHFDEIHLDNGFYTDLEYLVLPVKYIQTIVFLPNTIYMYRVSRTGQSVSTESFHRHMDMHLAVINRLENYLKNNREVLGAHKISYIQRRLVKMYLVQMRIFVTCTDQRQYKEKTKELFKHIKEFDPAMYKDFLASSGSARLLDRTNFIMYSIVSKRDIKRNVLH